MVRLFEHRAKYPGCPTVSGLLSAIGDIQHGIELGLANDEIADRAIDLAALTLRMAGEYQKPISSGAPSASSTNETPRPFVP